MANTKRFPLRVLLTVTTGRLLTKSKGPRDNGIGDLYEILGWMTNYQPFTHQLPRFGEECKPWLLRWFPELKAFDTQLEEKYGAGSLDYMLRCVEAAGHPADSAIESWLARWQVDFGAQDAYDVPRIPRDDHGVKNPFDELVEMRGTDEGIVIVNPKTGEVST